MRSYLKKSGEYWKNAKGSRRLSGNVNDDSIPGRTQKLRPEMELLLQEQGLSAESNSFRRGEY
jgi:hypothetical protein